MHIFWQLIYLRESAGGRLDCPYHLGVGIHYKCYDVCHKCFGAVYQIGDTTLYDIRSQVKRGFETSDCGARTGDGAQVSGEKNNPGFVRALQDLAAQKGVTLAAMTIPNSAASLSCFAWLNDYFDLMPNGHNMTIEHIDYEEVYDEYLWDMKPTREICLDMKSFRQVWSIFFPHIHRREYKHVRGKCSTCAALSVARKTHKDRMDREH